jgi:hypothetical protein
MTHSMDSMHTAPADDRRLQRGTRPSLKRGLQVVMVLIHVLACSAADAYEGFEGWNLEPGVNQAHLVMVARVASISRMTVVEGAKTDTVLREYRFQPVRKLKGIFQRDQLSMTAADLGCQAESATQAPPLKEGEFRLLILAQQRGIRSFGCVSAASASSTFDERVPSVTGPDDPLVGVVETLIRVADSQSRRERAKLLVDRLVDADGIPSIPLLTSLRLRADWAANDRRAFAASARLALNPTTAIRGAALALLGDMLANRSSSSDPRDLDGVAQSLRAVFDSDEATTAMKVAELEALGHLLALQGDIEWARTLLIIQLKGAVTHSERVAAATALAEIAHPEAVSAVLSTLAMLPLDEPAKRELAYARAAVKLDPAAAERVLLARLKRSISARESLEAEIDPLAEMRSQESVPLLLAAAAQPGLADGDRYHVARALGRLADGRAVPILASWLQSNDFQLRDLAIAALENLDSEAAAREARPWLKAETHLPFKLRLARLLARRGFADGYSLATEHLADVEHTAAATLVLASLKDPRTSNDLTAIIAAQPDRHWRAAALTGLAAIGDPAGRKQLLDILGDDRHALTAEAAKAAGLSGDVELLLPLAKLVQSRNKPIALAALVSVRRFLSGVRLAPRGLAAVSVPNEDALRPDGDVPAETRSALFESAASILLDLHVEADVRQEAFAAARLLGGDRYDTVLSQLADQAELEGAPTLVEVQAERRRRQGIEQRR